MAFTYAVLTQNGDVIDTDLNTAEAAQVILNHDGQDYAIRAAEYGFELWSRQQVAKRPWHRTVIFSAADNEADAEAEIFQKVIHASHNWRGSPYTMEMSDYNKMLAENEASDQ